MRHSNRGIKPLLQRIFFRHRKTRFAAETARGWSGFLPGRRQFRVKDLAEVTDNRDSRTLAASVAGSRNTQSLTTMARPTTPPTGREITFAVHEIIVSKTDMHGVITYANDVFLRIAGYTEEEVLGSRTISSATLTCPAASSPCSGTRSNPERKSLP